MPTITVDDGCPINVEVSGRDDAPALHWWDDLAG